MSVSNINSYASSMSTTAWWIAFAFTLTATVVFLVLSYIRNVKPEARLVRLPCCPPLARAAAMRASRAHSCQRRAVRREPVYFGF